MDIKTHWNDCEICLHQGDITELDVDAVVTAANAWLSGGGGVDGAIHAAGGPEILAACQRIMQERDEPKLAAGEAVITTGGALRARHVIHTVGPVYYEQGSREQAEALLAACYRRCLELAREYGLRTIAFPCISTGAYGYPPWEACPLALSTVREELELHGGLDQVIFCCFSRNDFELYAQTFEAMVAY